MRVLIVEDEAGIASALKSGLSDESYIVDVAPDGEEGLWAAGSGAYDLVILDVLLPKLSGTEVCRRLRAARNPVPILMLTARDTTNDIVAGLDAGANDYLTKPFAFEELLARVRALLRGSARSASAVIEIGELAIDTRSRRASLRGAELDLTTKEYQLAEYLAAHRGEVVSKERLVAALWEHDCEPESNALEVHVAALRKCLLGATHVGIRTIRGAGYQLREIRS